MQLKKCIIYKVFLIRNNWIWLFSDTCTSNILRVLFKSPRTLQMKFNFENLKLKLGLVCLLDFCCYTGKMIRDACWCISLREASVLTFRCYSWWERWSYHFCVYVKFLGVGKVFLTSWSLVTFFPPWTKNSLVVLQPMLAFAVRFWDLSCAELLVIS